VNGVKELLFNLEQRCSMFTDGKLLPNSTFSQMHLLARNPTTNSRLL